LRKIEQNKLVGISMHEWSMMVDLVLGVKSEILLGLGVEPLPG